MNENSKKSGKNQNQSFFPSHPVYVTASASIVGTKEGKGPFGELFDVVGKDNYFGCKSWAEAESTLQKEALTLALGKAGLAQEELQYLFGGDLLGQSIATSFGLASFSVPLVGLYGACSTCGLSLSMGTVFLSAGAAEHVGCVTSSHFASAEKEFRFPSAYGNQRPLSAHWTVTGSGAFILSREKRDNSRAKVTGITSGRIVDYGLKDSQNMGACMAPAAVDTVERHFLDFHSRPEEYDKIITGDLGSIGQRVLLDLLGEKGWDISQKHMDCGMEIFDREAQDVHAGGSGCGCCAVTLSAYILKQIEEGIWKKVLFVPTGALLSKTSFQEGRSVPAVAHGVMLEAV